MKYKHPQGTTFVPLLTREDEKKLNRILHYHKLKVNGYHRVRDLSGREYPYCIVFFGDSVSNASHTITYRNSTELRNYGYKEVNINSLIGQDFILLEGELWE